MSLIVLSKENTTATIETNGAWVKSFRVGEQEVLMPGFKFEKDSKIKIRGGIPLLFPNAGQAIKTEKLCLAQHGFARDLVWENVKQQSDLLVLRLVDFQNTFSIFPYHFVVEAVFAISKNLLKLSLNVFNNDKVNIPLAPGFHPYFNLVKNNRVKLKLNENKFKYDGLTSYKNSKSPIKFQLPYCGNILLSFSDNLKNVSYWSEQDGDFICIEPWVGGEKAILDNSLRINLEPSKKVQFNLNIEKLL